MRLVQFFIILKQDDSNLLSTLYCKFTFKTFKKFYLLLHGCLTPDNTYPCSTAETEAMPDVDGQGLSYRLSALEVP